MLETIRCISKFGQIVATVPFYTRASFDIVWYSINKSTICRPPKYRDFLEIKKFHLRSPIERSQTVPAGPFLSIIAKKMFSVPLITFIKVDRNNTCRKDPQELLSKKPCIHIEITKNRPFLVKFSCRNIKFHYNNLLKIPWLCEQRGFSWLMTEMVLAR
jgi:hypothetical protein